MDRKIKILLKGKLKSICKVSEIELSGRNVAELISGLCLNFPELKPFNLQQPKLILSVIGFNTKQSLYEDLPEGLTEIILVPTMSGGGGKGGFFQILVATVFIAVSFALGGPGGASATASVLFSTGVSLAIGGILSILQGTRKAESLNSSTQETSKYLGSNQNTIESGTAIPVLYGKTMVGGHYLSFNVEPIDIDVNRTLGNAFLDIIYKIRA